MTTVISLKVPENILDETSEVLSTFQRQNQKISRNAYINKALDFYNRTQKREILRAQLAKESHRIADESLDVLHEFEAFTDTDVL